MLASTADIIGVHIAMDIMATDIMATAAIAITAIGTTAMAAIGTTATGPTSMDPPAAIPAESTAGTATESHLTEPGRLKSGVQVAHNLPCRLLRSSGHGQGIMPFAINEAVLGLKRSEAKSMRTLVLSTAVIAGVAPANAAPPSMSGISNTKIEVGTVKNVGYWRRYYRRYGYPVPYAYYPPANGYDVPPAAYSYPPATSYAPPPGDDYVDAPPSEGDYNDEGNYGNGQPQEGDYAGAPPPEGY